jgi:4-alpha-glucanotransferase
MKATLFPYFDPDGLPWRDPYAQQVEALQRVADLWYEALVKYRLLSYQGVRVYHINGVMWFKLLSNPEYSQDRKLGNFDQAMSVLVELAESTQALMFRPFPPMFFDTGSEDLIG